MAADPVEHDTDGDVQPKAIYNASVSSHYENLLAPIYAWMMGGAGKSIARGQEELSEAGLLDGRIRYAVDLGAGFGMHAIPLSRAGALILAIDSSALLLQELNTLAGGAGVEVVRDDLRHFTRHLCGRPDLVLCMGDTLAHLPDRSSVTTLMADVAGHITTGGRFLVSFRDYSTAREGEDRFLSVRNEKERLLTCFLEYEADTVRVHDILHEVRDGAWQMRVSPYRKLRLTAEWVWVQLERFGFTVTTIPGPGGLVRFLGRQIRGFR